MRVSIRQFLFALASVTARVGNLAQFANQVACPVINVSLANDGPHPLHSCLTLASCHLHPPPDAPRPPRSGVTLASWHLQRPPDGLRQFFGVIRIYYQCLAQFVAGPGKTA